VKPKTAKPKCKALNKDGKPCGAAPTDGGLCFFHAHPNKVAELGRKGGQKNRHVQSETLTSLPPIRSVSDVRERTAHLLDELLAGRLHPRLAHGAAPLLNVLLRANTAAENAALRDELNNLRAEFQAAKETLERTRAAITSR